MFKGVKKMNKKWAVFVLGIITISPLFVGAEVVTIADKEILTTDRGLVGLGAAIAIGLAVLGGALGQGRAASSALDGIARNPGSQNKVFMPLILSLALMESLVIFALLIAFTLVGKV